MTLRFEKLFKSEEEVRQDILRDFAIEFLVEVEQLVSMFGKEEVMEMISDSDDVGQDVIIIKKT